VTDPLAQFRRNYRPPFLAYLVREDEGGRQAAYDLGREAMSSGVGLIGLVTVHNEVFLDAVSDERTAESALRTARAAGAFLVEALASFEMTQRGFMDGARVAGQHPDDGPSARPSP
jgi:hypothetical protein